jgi:HEAT repeats
MAKDMRSSLVGGLLGLSVVSTMALGQVVEKERETTVTGPKGRTIQRDITVQKGPGFINRQVEVKRPGETIIRDTRIQTGPGGGRFGGPPAFNGGIPRFYGGPRFVQNVIVPQPAVAGFIGLPPLGLFFGGGGGGGGVGIGGGGPVPPPPGGPGGPPPPPPGFDAFADAVGRLKSFHASSRRDGALALGRMGDPRAVLALNERLEHDFDKDVRVASAWALGEIGDERGAVALERAVLSEKWHHEVRDAAATALKKLPKPGEVRAPRTTTGPVSLPSTSPVPDVIQSRPSEIDPGPNPQAIPGSNPPANPEPVPADQPPPPPLPIPQLDRPTNSAPPGNPS